VHPGKLANVDPKKGLFQQEIHLPTIDFQGDMLVFQGVGTRSVHFNQWLVPFGSLCNEGLRLAMYHIRLIPNLWEGNVTDSSAWTRLLAAGFLGFPFRKTYEKEVVTLEFFLLM